MTANTKSATPFKSLRYWLFSLLILMISCKVKQQLRWADDLEKRGNTAEAIHLYSQICFEYSKSVACDNLQRLVTAKVDSLMMAARTAAENGNCTQATMIFNSAESFLRENHGQTDDFNRVHSWRQPLMQQCYGILLAESEEKLLNAEFEEAERISNLIPENYSAYEKARQIHQLARLSMLFSMGDKFQAQGEWSRAYDLYAEIHEVDPIFMDVKSRMEACLIHLKKSMAYVAVPSSVSDEETDRRTEAMVCEKTKALMGDRITILERTDLELLIEEHRKQMHIAFDENSGATFGELERASYFLTAQWISLDFIHTPARQESCDCSAVYGLSNELANCHRTYTGLTAKGEIKIQLLQASSGEVLMSQLLSCEEVSQGLRHDLVLTSKGENSRTQGTLPVLQDPGDLSMATNLQLLDRLLQKISIKISDNIYQVFAQ